MDIHKLELLLDIVATHNLTASAENFGYTQSAVSHSIKKLESETGFPLLKRTNRGVDLTNDARSLLPAIRSVVSSYHHLQEDIQAVQGIRRGSLCIGTYSSIAIRWLPSVIRRLQREYPDISIKIREGGLTDIEQWIQEGIVDFGLLSKTSSQNFSFRPLAEEPLYAVLPLDFDLPSEYENAFPVEAFRNYPFIASEFGWDIDVSSTLEKAGVQPPVAFYCKDDHSIIAMVENGLGISLLPSLIVEGYETKIRKIPLAPMCKRSLGVGILSEKTLSLSGQTVVRMVEEYVKSLNA